MSSRLLPERPARGGQHDLVDSVALIGLEHLENGRMLGIHRQQGGTMGGNLRHHQRSGADQAFLVGQSHHHAPAHRFQGRRQTGGTDDGRHHPVGGQARRLDHRLGPGGGFDAAAGQQLPQTRQGRFVGEDGQTRTQPQRLIRQQIGAGIGHQGFGAIKVGPRLDQLHRVATDGTGRAQNGDCPPRVAHSALVTTTTIAALPPPRRR